MSDKISFLELPVTVDVEALRADLAAIADTSWRGSYWPGTHGFVDFVLLRGGTAGDESDFYSTETVEQPILAELPHMAKLIRPEGPFGGAHYAYVFRMRPGGVARLHRDAMPIWHQLFRVHVPIVTNPGARLVVGDRRGLHFGVGRAFTFDNQDVHGFVNGDTTRAHLILDVPPFTPAMERLLEQARVLDGEPVGDGDWARLAWPT